MSQFQRALKSHFSRALFTKSESQTVLLDIKTEMLNSLDLVLVLSELSNLYTGKMRSLCLMIIDEIERGVSFDDAFYMCNLISQDEQLIMKRAKGTREAINLILEFRKNGNFFKKVAMKLYLPLTIAIAVGFIGILIATPIILGMLDEFSQIVVLKNGFKPEFLLPFFMEDLSSLYIMIAIYATIISSILFAFYYLSTYNRAVMYKMFPLFFYDDFVRYFTIADGMKKVGATSDQIFEDLAENSPIGLKPIFRECSEKGTDYSDVFEIYNAPRRVVQAIRRLEKNSKFWTDMNSLVEYVNILRVDKNQLYTTFYAKPMFYLGLITGAIMVLTPMLYFMLNVYSFIS